MTDPAAHFDVFLSHNGADKPAVEALAQRLLAAGFKPWLDSWNLVPGDPWQEGLEEALDTCTTCAVFLGPSGIGPWHNEELRVALDRRARDRTRSFRVIPVLLPAANPADPATLPPFLSRMTWVDFRGGLNDAEAFRRLVAGIQGVAPGPGLSAGTITSETMPRPDATIVHPIQPTHLSAIPDTVTMLTTLPVDLGTAWGVPRGSFVGILVGWMGDGAREVLLTTEGMLWDVHSSLPVRWWLTISLDRFPNGPQAQTDIWKSCVDRNDPLLMHILQRDGRLPEQIILGLYCDIAVEHISDAFLDRLQHWCQKIIDPALGLSEVVLVVHITANLPQRALLAARWVRERSASNQCGLPLEVLKLAWWPGPATSPTIVIQDPTANDPFAPSPWYEIGHAIFSWIAKATAQHGADLQRQTSSYASVRKVYQQFYGKFGALDHLPAARFVSTDIDALETESVPELGEEFLSLVENYLPGLTAKLVRARAGSQRPQARQTAFEFVVSLPDLVRSDALVDAWLEGIASMPNPSTAFASLELSALPSGITLAERLLLGLLRECRHGVVNSATQTFLDMMQSYLPNNIRPVFDLCIGSLSEDDFLERCGAEEFAAAVRARIDFETLPAKLSAAGLTRPDLWWLLTALAMTPQRLSELLAMSGPERAIVGLCTAEEWQQIQQDIVSVRDVITCRRERPLHYLYQRTH